MKKLILASTSPRRRELLKKLGREFVVLTADIDETLPDNVDITAAVCQLAIKKAGAVWERAPKDRLIVAADTVVCLDNEVFGKPIDAADAKRMLTRLSGRTHMVVTGFAVMDAASLYTVSRYEKTFVTFKKLSEREINGYVATGEPLDKAGSYGIQALGGGLAESIDGDFENVIGLPVASLTKLLEEEFG